MTALLREAGRRIEPSADDGFEVSYVADDCAEHRVPLEQAWGVPLEQFIPVRRFRSRKGQRHLSGLWWSATTGGHVGFESWLERDQVLHLDFDPSVVGIASQPFWLHWTDEAGKPASHAPDFSPAAGMTLTATAARARNSKRARTTPPGRRAARCLTGPHELVQVV